MAYQPLPLKYRPLRWADLIGQQVVVKTMTNMLEQNRVAHSIICAGSRGTGKTTSARILARVLNCTNRQGHEPCLQCGSCQAIGDEESYAVREMDAASNGLVDDVRKIKEEVQYVSMEGAYRIYIIDECHALTTQAWQAFLKTLEEPPPNVVFVFCTTESHKIPDTIISRSLTFQFNRITNDHLVERLTQVCNLEGISVPADALRFIATHARGGMRDALTLLDQAVTYNGSKNIDLTTVKSIVNACSTDNLFHLFKALVQKDIKQVYALLDRIYREIPDLSILISDLATVYRQVMLTKVGVPLEDATPDHVAQCEEAAGMVTLEYLVEAQSAMHFISEQLRHSYHSPRHVVEVYITRLFYQGLPVTAQPQQQAMQAPPPVSRVNGELSPHQLAEKLGGLVM